MENLQQQSELDFGYLQRKKLDAYLSELVSKGGSDLHIRANGVIRGRYNGEIQKMSDDILSYEDAMALTKEILRTNFDNLVVKKSVDFTYKLNEDYRFRANAFFQIDGVSMVFRTIPTKIPNMQDLFLPPVLEKLCNNVNRGFILVTGPTGSGKTTTLSSMINYINKNKNRHIITIEDPIEFIFSEEKSIINQRGIGQDVHNFSDALRAALREDPDVILVGEMRDLETIRTAMAAAETGHLVLATLHTLDAKETVGRVINMFPKEEQNRIKMTFSSVVEAIICQRFVRTVDDKRRVAVEVLVKNTRIKDMILDGREDEIYDAIEQSRNTYGMQTFEQHLLELYNEGIIDKHEALEKSSRRSDLELRIKNADLAKRKMLLENSDNETRDNEGIIALKEI
ncbi:type IV pilus twitching motility protein PilT [Campylobacter sp. RM16192]|uniref:type IV pilus twitching motility protein PilT n=1 Tax=Campylobacter sp. RM16192 TaxID=1660080 RepID=UPI001451D881|nr:PilT/PilU family type 4a pilus ATPase [Campylobacter sp. RM16192]QCD53281.1 type II/IV secretion system protein, PilT/PilU family [Campylobacter sp. RM16192]